MPTRETEAQGLGAAVREVAERASSIVHLELELAALEVKRKVVALGHGIGFAIGAAFMLLFMVAFAYAAIAAALTLVLPTWAALLVVTGILLLQAGLLGALAVNRIKKGSPPVPEQAILEARLTTEALKSNGR
jgi:VIT1/CCC1 family predicted Fe2+/Mn2+ transporter